MQASRRFQAVLGALALAGVALPSAGAGPLDDLDHLAAQAVTLAGSTAQGAVGSAGQLTGQALADSAAVVAGAAGLARNATSTAQGAVAGAALAARDAATQALEAAAHAPDALVAEANRKYDDLEQAPPLAGEFLKRRVHSVPDLDRPWIESFNETFGPYIERLGNITIQVGSNVTTGPVPGVDVRLGALPPPPPEQVLADAQGYVGRNLPTTFAWAEGTTQDTVATTAALAELVAR